MSWKKKPLKIILIFITWWIFFIKILIATIFGGMEFEEEMDDSDFREMDSTKCTFGETSFRRNTPSVKHSFSEMYRNPNKEHHWLLKFDYYKIIVIFSWKSIQMNCFFCLWHIHVASAVIPASVLQDFDMCLWIVDYAIVTQFLIIVQ